ncbi:hypothetical protein NQZ68_042284, partial [Dissostichus eleginoides]
MGCCNGGSNPVEDLATFNVLRAWTTHFACCSEWNPKGPHTYHPTHLKPIVCTISGFPRIKSVGPEEERSRSDRGTYRTSPDKISPGLGEPSPTNISCAKAPPIWKESPPRISHGRPRSDRGKGHFSTELVPTCWGNQVRSITAVPEHRPTEKTEAHLTSHDHLNPVSDQTQPEDPSLVTLAGYTIARKKKAKVMEQKTSGSVNDTSIRCRSPITPGTGW